MKKIVITMLVLLSAAYAVGIGGGEVARKLNLRPSQIVPAADTLPVRNLIYLIGDGMGLSHVSMLMLEEGYGYDRFRPGAEHRIDYYLFSQQPGDGLRSGRYGAGDGT